MTQLKFALGLLFIFIFNYCQSQNITFQVLDQNTRIPLQGVIVYNNNKAVGVSNENGIFQTTTTFDSIGFQLLGYEKLSVKYSQGIENIQPITLFMKETSSNINTIVVSGSRNGKRLAEETASIEVLKKNMIYNSNPTKVSEVVTKISGVYMMDGQANMRGGTGFTYGAGSRVQLIVDGMPLLSGDRADVKWSLVPIENVESIEVLKGSASALYGSSALNGVISINTAWPTSTTAKHQYTLNVSAIGNPDNKEAKWWDTPPYSATFTGLDMKKIKNLDLVINYAAARTRSQNKGESLDYGRFHIKTRWNNTKIKGLSYGLNFNSMILKEGNFYLWANSENMAYQPYGGDIENPGTTIKIFRYLWFSLDPHITYYTKNGGKLSYKGRYYINNYIDNIAFKFTDKSLLNDHELQWSSVPSKYFSYTVGGRFNHVKVESGGLGNHNGNTAAIFAQGELSILKCKFNIGLRSEALNIDTVKAWIPLVGKIGKNVQLSRSTFWRSSFGQGFRLPSFAEVYVSDKIDNVINIFPNYDLKPEIGWNAETGIKQALKVNEWNATLDGVLFVSEIKNLTEYVFDYYVNTPVGDSVQSGLGFKSKNFPFTRVSGTELACQAEGKIWNDIYLNIIGGYTYTFPADLENNPDLKSFKNYWKAATYAFQHRDSVVLNQIMNYRYRHLAKIDVEAKKQNVTLGFAYNRFSAIEKVDNVFLGLLTSLKLKEYLEKNKNGFGILNLRVGYQFNESSTINLVVNNVLNREYALRPTKMDSPRNISIAYKLSLL